MSDTKRAELKLKKYLSQYDYLTSELTEAKYLFEDYNKTFLQECYGINPGDKSSKGESGTECVPEQVDESSSEENMEASVESVPEEIEKVDERLKRLYKKLSLKTHPDKGGDRRIFEELKEAYDAKDAVKLLLLSNTLGVVDNGYTSEETIEMLEGQIQEMQGKIDHYKRTLAWNWASASESDKEKWRNEFKL
jgi:chaperonin cofactor prefoldin